MFAPQYEITEYENENFDTLTNLNNSTDSPTLSQPETIMTKLMSKTETHSQLIKCFQCISSILSYFSNTIIQKNHYSKLSFQLSMMRKVFRIFRFFNEIPRLQFLYSCNYDNITKNLNFLTRIFAAIFYLLENITILQHLKILNEDNLVTIELLMGVSFLLSQIFQNAYYFYILNRSYSDEEDLKNQDGSFFKLKDVYLKLKKLSRIRFQVWLGILRTIGEIFLAFHDMKILQGFLSNSFLNFITSFTGLISALISIWFIIAKN